MSSCLGFYINENIVKYAKMTMDNNQNIALENYGVRYVKESLKNVLNSIIDETNSAKSMITINSQKDVFLNYSMFDQVSTKNFSADVAKMEFESWCERTGKVANRYSYVYKVAEIKNAENKYNVALNIMDKETISEYNDVGNMKLSNMYPVQLLMKRLVPQEEKNYVLVNMDDKLSISVVVDGKVLDFKFYDFGMKNLIDGFSEVLGSYQKAYEACKQLNVYSDEETNNDKKLEEIAEPVLQDVLKSTAVMVNKYSNYVDKVILSGQGIVFTNIDILFREYLDKKCDILKPDFLKDPKNIRNIAEALESTSAMALALENLSPREKTLDYVKGGEKLKNKFTQLFTKTDKQDKKEEKSTKENKQENTMTKENKVSSESALNTNTDVNPVISDNPLNNDKLFDKEMERLNKNDMLNTSSVSNNQKTLNQTEKLNDTKKVNKEEKDNKKQAGESKIPMYLTCTGIVCALGIIAYFVFSMIYFDSVEKTLAKLEEAKMEIVTEKSKLSSDVSYINTNTNQYKQINNKVEEIVKDIEKNNVSKYTTYNVAAFLQNIIKIIPKEVQLKTITSDDNKNIVITATADDYADLGYFISELKLSGTLQKIKILNVQNNTSSVVEIGGELP